MWLTLSEWSTAKTRLEHLCWYFKRKRTLLAEPPRLHHLSAINVAFIAVILAFALQLDAQFVDSGIWLGGSVTRKLPSWMNDAKGSWRVWMDGQLRFGDDSSGFS
jgi:hypothetical protein